MKIEWIVTTQFKYRTTTWISIDKNMIDVYNDKVMKSINLLEFYETYCNIDFDGINIPKSMYGKDSKIGYVYEIENMINNKKYIGRTINPISRLYDHIRSSSNIVLKSDFKKYGLVNFNYKSWKSKNYKYDEDKLIRSSENIYNLFGVIKNKSAIQ